MAAEIVEGAETPINVVAEVVEGAEITINAVVDIVEGAETTIKVVAEIVEGAGTTIKVAVGDVEDRSRCHTVKDRRAIRQASFERAVRPLCHLEFICKLHLSSQTNNALPSLSHKSI